jgi:hypothetical protein
MRMKCIARGTGMIRGTMERSETGDQTYIAMSESYAEVMTWNPQAPHYRLMHVLLSSQRRLVLEEIDERHPDLLEALRTHPHIGFLLVRSRDRGPVVLGARGARYLDPDRVDGEDPLAAFTSAAAAHLRWTDGFAHVADIMVNTFYDPDLEQGCAFEELISFHGGLGDPQTQQFIVHPVQLPMPDRPIVGAAAVHDLLTGWRRSQQDPDFPVGMEACVRAVV